MDTDESFIPRIIGLFYAEMVPAQSGGSRVIYQVPNNLISTSTSAHTARVGGPGDMSGSLSSLPSVTSESAPFTPQPNRSTSRVRSQRTRSPGTSPMAAPSITSTSNPTHKSARRPLLKFDPIAEYIVPHSALCNKLVTVTSGPYKVMGFPVCQLDTPDRKKGYDRGQFKWNVCWVFDRWKYQGGEFDAVVRKTARVLSEMEAESSFLSSSETTYKIYSILEQLFEDLNSYGETSIPIDQSNSIEIKIFPQLPNPVAVEDWHVPLPLIDLEKMKEPNWDLALLKIVPHIDGIAHVKKIAAAADVSTYYAKIGIEHLMYYEACMLVDIFQFANMYTIKPAIAQLAEVDHVILECAPYCMKDPDGVMPPWPTLLKLYAALRPGLTLSDWSELHNVSSLGIDIRRFVSFGVIKGILRRVHRWPVFIQPGFTPSNTDPFFDESETPMGPGSPRTIPGGIVGTGTITSTGTSGLPKQPSTDGFNSSGISGRSLSLPASQGRSVGSLRGSQGRSRMKLMDEFEDPWGSFGYPAGLTIDHLDGDHNSDQLCVELGIPWGGERGLEKALEAFGKVNGGTIALIYR
ncbi:Nitrogen permease regulator NLRG/NPR2 [Phaffia rhodozyma]|uniref:Nitrogen permease regulator NLRG/NPR2 n=1 Tax=Phaffia rhodozyma TaxID=264483 RepID=A0A0F7SVM0_PHARH|nr:Nitrogen permease regulator NLRG/NPR2 [Phaffia rhodozyma]